MSTCTHFSCSDVFSSGWMVVLPEECVRVPILHILYYNSVRDVVYETLTHHKLVLHNFVSNFLFFTLLGCIDLFYVDDTNEEHTHRSCCGIMVIQLVLNTSGECNQTYYLQFYIFVVLFV